MPMWLFFLMTDYVFRSFTIRHTIIIVNVFSTPTFHLSTIIAWENVRANWRTLVANHYLDGMLYMGIGLVSVLCSFFPTQLCFPVISWDKQLTLSQNIILKLIFIFVCQTLSHSFVFVSAFRFLSNVEIFGLLFAWEITDPDLYVAALLLYIPFSVRIQPFYVQFLSLAITISA